MNCMSTLAHPRDPACEARYNLTPVRHLGHKFGSGLAMEEWERLRDELHGELSLRERELDLLHAIDLQLLEPEQSHQPQEIFNFIVQNTKKLLQASHTTILLRRSTFLEPMYSSLKSVIGQRVPISESLTGYSLESDSLVNVMDLTISELNTRYAPLRGYRGPRMRSLLATPVKVRGYTVGVLNAESTHVKAFKTVHERIALAIAAQVGIALQRTETLASDILFADVDRLMFASDDPQNVVQDSEHAIQTALEKVMAELKRLEHVQHTGAQIMFVRGDDELEIMHSTNSSDVGLMVPIGKSVSGRAVRERETIIVGDVDDEEEYVRLLGSSIRSEIAVPILFGEEDLVIGVLNVESDESNAFYGFYQVVLESFAQKVRTLLAFAKLRADVTEALELRSADDLLLAIGDQASHMVHQVNNIVGAMRFRIKELQGMQENGSLKENSLKEALAALYENAERTLKMPDEVTKQLKGTSVDVNECVRKAISQIKVPEGVVLDLRLADGIPRLPLFSFEIVVQNLIKNGIDAMPAGGLLSVCTSIVFDKTLSTGYLQLSVSDTGHGISSDVQKRMFELNFTTKHEEEKGKGLGLGLWWVRNFVRRARGDITVRSTIGSGTNVSVKIPINRSSAAV
jgi:signal transduction histidine kinase